MVTLTGTRVAVLAAIAACSVAAWGPAAAASPASFARCEKITVKGADPGPHWGVYVSAGKVGCATAGMVLAGVLADKGKPIPNNGDGGVTYDGWLCPYAQMGAVTCQYGTTYVPRPRRSIFARNCSNPGCPARAEL
jgi:hypothetical protein